MRYVTDLHEAGVVEFRLQDCPGIEPKGELPFNILPIAAALRYNTYFKAISAVQLLKKDVLYSLCSILRYNSKITKLTLSQLSEGNITELGEALQYNQNNALQIIDLSGTHITKGVSIFCQTLQSFPHSLKVLNLSNCGMDGKQISAIVDSLASNYGMSLTIEELDLSNNKFDEQASGSFETWLSKSAQYSRLQVLRLANTSQSFSTVAAYFHFLKDLQELDVSNSKLDKRAVQLLCSTLEKSTTLKYLNVSNCTLSNGLGSAIVEAFLTNKNLRETSLIMSASDLTEQDAELFSKGLSLNINCHTLDISKNKFKEMGLIGILQAIVLSATSKLDTLILDNTYKNTYEGERVASALMSVSNSLSCVKSISIAGGYKSVTIPFLNYLQTNTSLLELDISNNAMGDSAASAIADMLRVNDTLLRLRCDGNNISPSGWKMILASFMHNRTLVEMDFPWKDYERYSSLPKDKLEELRAVLIDIQRALQTNHSSDKMERLHPPPSRPLPTFVHPSASLPDKLTHPTESGLSSLAASKINVESRASLSKDDGPCLFDATDYDPGLDSSTTESEIENLKIRTGSNSSMQSGGTTPNEEWYTDSESFSDEEYDQNFQYTSNDRLSSGRGKAAITLANLNGRNPISKSISSDEKIIESSSTSTKIEESEEESMMSSDSSFDI